MHTLEEESYAMFKTAACTLNWQKANKGFDVLICFSATRCSTLPDKTNT